MKKFIVTTTINQPTKAIRAFDSMEDWHLIVIGDLKTPKDYRLRRGTFVPAGQQLSLGLKCVSKIPWNCIQRRNIGYLLAIREGADVIATVDDDNIPLAGWGEGVDLPLKDVNHDVLMDRVNTVVDPLYLHQCDLRARGHTNLKLWHRGFPVQSLEDRFHHSRYTYPESATVDVVADLWNGDPDVDAVCRIAHGPFDLEFKDDRFLIGKSNYAPFNTQNTFFSRRIAPCMCLPFDIGRMDDIWASYMTQRVMKELGSQVLFRGPSVRQERNPHDLSKDLEKEVVGYRHTPEFVRRLDDMTFSGRTDEGSIMEMYLDLAAAIYDWDIISEEMHAFQLAWIGDISGFI